MEETRLIEFRCIRRNEEHTEFVRSKHTPEEAATSVAEYLAAHEADVDEFWIEVHDPDRRTPYLFKAVRDPRPRMEVIDHTNGAELHVVY